MHNYLILSFFLFFLIIFIHLPVLSYINFDIRATNWSTIVFDSTRSPHHHYLLRNTPSPSFLCHQHNMAITTRDMHLSGSYELNHILTLCNLLAPIIPHVQWWSIENGLHKSNEGHIPLNWLFELKNRVKEHRFSTIHIILDALEAVSAINETEDWW